MMNSRQLFMVMLTACPLLLTGQWTLQHPLPVYQDLHSIAQVNDSVYVAVGKAGTTIKSQDGGNTWYIIDFESSGDLLCVEFPAPGNGWIIEKPDKLYHSVDEGDTWQPVPMEFINFTDLFFVDEFTGWLVGRDGFILKTIDAGETWSSYSVGSLYDIETIFFTSRDTGWVAGIGGFILRTCDGGITWEGSNWGQQRTIRDIYFINGSEGWCAGDRGYVSHSMNGGASWSTDQIGSSYSEIIKIFFINPDSVWAFEDGDHLAAIYFNRDGNWSQDMKYVFPIFDFVISEDATIRTVGRKGEIAVTNDLFKNWTSISHVSHSPTAKIFFVNEWTGWTLGTDLLRTCDGGDHWELANINGYSDFYRGDFVDDDTAFVCAASGSRNYILRTANGGNDWEEVLELMPQYAITEIDFIDAEQGWVLAGQHSQYSTPGEANRDYVIDVYHTKDAGNTWTVESQESLGQVYDVQFVSPEIGYVITGVNLYKTSDAGKSWELLHNNGSHRHMEFVDEMTGLLAGRTPGLYKTSDGGISWDTMHTGFYGEINGIDLLDTNFFVCVGDSGYVLITRDGGQRWSKHKVLPDENNLWGVSFINKNEGWIGSYDNPIIMHTTNGGVSWTAEEVGLGDHNPVKLYPNPSDGRIWISIHDTHFFRNVTRFQLFSINGKNVYSGNVRNINVSTTIYLDLPQLPAGVYIWRLSSEETQFSGKIILQ